MKKDHRAGAFFLTEPLDNHGWEWRCYMRDPNNYFIEVRPIYSNRPRLVQQPQLIWQPIPSSNCSKPTLLL